MVFVHTVDSVGTMTQEELLRFVGKETRKTLLSCPPFNIPHMLSTAVVCLLFPGIVLGQSRAIGITVALLATLLATWLWDAPVWTERLLIFWGIWSGIVWLLWQLILFLGGLSGWLRGHRWQKPGEDAPEGIAAPWEKVLHWERENDTLYRACFPLHAPKQGLYLLELKLQDEAADKTLQWEGVTACCEEREILPGVLAKHHAIFRLLPGNHTITLVLNTDKPPVKSTISQLNHV